MIRPTSTIANLRAANEARASMGKIRGQDLLVFMHDMAKELCRKYSQDTAAPFLKEVEDNKSLSEAQLLEALSLTLKSEELSLRFDYVRLFKTCFEIMEGIRNRCSQAAVGGCGFSEWAKSASSYELVNEILWSAAERERDLHDFESNKKIDHPDLLKVCAEVVSEVAGRDGDSLLEQAKARLSRSVANPQMRPKNISTATSSRPNDSKMKGLGLKLDGENLSLTHKITKPARLPVAPCMCRRTSCPKAKGGVGEVSPGPVL